MIFVVYGLGVWFVFPGPENIANPPLFPELYTGGYTTYIQKIIFFIFCVNIPQTLAYKFLRAAKIARKTVPRDTRVEITLTENEQFTWRLE